MTVFLDRVSLATLEEAAGGPITPTFTESYEAARDEFLRNKLSITARLGVLEVVNEDRERALAIGFDLPRNPDDIDECLAPNDAVDSARRRAIVCEARRRFDKQVLAINATLPRDQAPFRTLSQARAEAARRAGEGAGQAARFFDRVEVDRLRARLDGAGLEAKLGVIACLVDSFGTEALPALAELGLTDCVFAAAGAAALEGRLAVAREILAGQTWLHENEKSAGALSRDAVSQLEGRVARLLPQMNDAADAGDASTMVGITEAIVAVVINRLVTKGRLHRLQSDGAIDAATFVIDASRVVREAVDDVTGGVVDFNGCRVIVPMPGTTAETMTRVWRRTNRTLLETTFGARLEATVNGRRRRIPEQLIHESRLMRVSADEYLVLACAPGDEFVPLYDVNAGSVFRLRWSVLERQVSNRPENADGGDGR